MYAIIDLANTVYLSSDDLELIYHIATRNSFDEILVVQNTITQQEVMLSNGRIVSHTTNEPHAYSKYWSN